VCECPACEEVGSCVADPPACRELDAEQCWARSDCRYGSGVLPCECEPDAAGECRCPDGEGGGAGVPADEAPIWIGDGLCYPADCGARTEEECSFDGSCELLWPPCARPREDGEVDCHPVCTEVRPPEDCRLRSVEQCLQDGRCKLQTEWLCWDEASGADAAGERMAPPPDFCEEVTTCVPALVEPCEELPVDVCEQTPGCHVEEIADCFDCECPPCPDNAACEPCACPACVVELICVADGPVGCEQFSRDQCLQANGCQWVALPCVCACPDGSPDCRCEDEDCADVGSCLPVGPEACSSLDPETCRQHPECALELMEVCEGCGCPPCDPNDPDCPMCDCAVDQCFHVEVCVPAPEPDWCTELPEDKCLLTPGCRWEAADCECACPPDDPRCECNCPGRCVAAAEQCLVDADCPAGALCHQGVCVDLDPCAAVRCRDGYVCQEGRCVELDACANVACAPGEACIDGVCQEVAEVLLMGYTMTQCADPWAEACAGAVSAAECIARYLEDAWGVRVFGVDIVPTAEGPAACAACNCSAGKILYVKTDAAGSRILAEHLFWFVELDS